MNSGSTYNHNHTGSSAGGGSGNTNNHSHPGQGIDNIWGNSPEFSSHSPSTASNHLHSLINPPTDVNSNATPSILLEQLAFVDNFMTDFNSDFGPNVTNSLYNTNDGSHGDFVGSFGGMNVENHVGAMSAENQLAMDERLAAELSVFADETFIFPDEDKADMNDSDGNGNNFGNNDPPGPNAHNNISNNTNNNNNSNNNNNNSNNGIRNSSEKRNLFDRKSNLLGNQYDHTRQRFSRKRSLTHNSPVPDHGGFTNFEVQDQSGNHNTSNPSDHPSGSNVTRQRDVPFVTSPLTNLLAAHDLTAMSYPSNTSVSSASSIVNTVNNHNNHVNGNDNAYRSNTAASSGFDSSIQMPDYSTIQTATLVSLLPIFNVPRGAYHSLRNVGFKPEQIDAIAAIMAYYEREREKFDPPMRRSGRENNSSSIRPPSTSFHVESAANANTHTQVPPEPQERVQSSVSMLLDFLHEKPEQQTQSSAVEPQPKRIKKAPEQKDSLIDKILTNDTDSYVKSSLNARADASTKQVKDEDENVFSGKSVDDVNAQSKLIKNKGASTSSFAANSVDDLKESTGRSKDVGVNGKEDNSKDVGEISGSKKDNEIAKSKLSSFDDGEKSSSPSSSLPSRPKLPNLDQTKKLKEKEMETWVKDLSQLACDLKQRINTLEMENKLLKNLVIERGDLKNLQPFENSKKASSENTKKETDN
ncbi:unnamed protein product [Kluyveromyces dobzhanskii CBS 2104]|uniref:WGS project CCBQ000000000 data, contig 00015 n=1 Tax=Kluyveromyces dobzhanskii CBS 2104 TaxID=1427455 RepID=A0A0A8L932_9SACH|nr:unnamed protein product [Kluyveromyces dobzhanskii CBS 2104]